MNVLSQITSLPPFVFSKKNLEINSQLELIYLQDLKCKSDFETYYARTVFSLTKKNSAETISEGS